MSEVLKKQIANFENLLEKSNKAIKSKNIKKIGKSVRNLKQQFAENDRQYDVKFLKKFKSVRSPDELLKAYIQIAKMMIRKNNNMIKKLETLLNRANNAIKSKNIINIGNTTRELKNYFTENNIEYNVNIFKNNNTLRTPDEILNSYVQIAKLIIRKTNRKKIDLETLLKQSTNAIKSKNIKSIGNIIRKLKRENGDVMINIFKNDKAIRSPDELLKAYTQIARNEIRRKKNLLKNKKKVLVSYSVDWEGGTSREAAEFAIYITSEEYNVDEFYYNYLEKVDGTFFESYEIQANELDIEKEIEKKIEDDLEKYIHKNLYIKNFSIRDIVQEDVKNIKDIRDVKMLNERVLYDWSVHIQNNTNMCCVETYLLNKFATRKPFNNPRSKYYMTLEKLREFTDEFGYSIHDVKNICDCFGIRMVAYDIDEEELESFEPEVIPKSIRDTTLSFVISDNHMYPMEGNKKLLFLKRKKQKTPSLKNTYLVKKDTKDYHFNKISKNEFNPRVVEIEQKEFEFISKSELLKKFDNNQNIKKVIFNGDIAGITIQEGDVLKRYLKKPTYDIKEEYEDLNIVYTSSLSPADLGVKLMPNLDHVIPEDMEKIMKTDSFRDVRFARENFELKPKKNAVAYDINLAYTQALKNDYIQLNSASNIEKTNKYDGPGYYYGFLEGIEKNHPLGYLWYPCCNKDQFKNLKDVSYFINGNLVVRPFDEFLETVKKIPERKDGEKLRKHTINHAIGCLARKNKTEYRIVRTHCWDQAIRLFHKGHKIKTINTVNGDLYICSKKYKTPLVKNQKLIYNQILFRSYDNLLKLSKYFKKVYSIKTDSIYGILKQTPPPKFAKKDANHSFTQLYNFEKEVPKMEFEIYQPQQTVEELYDWINNPLTDELLDITIQDRKNTYIRGWAGFAKTGLCRLIIEMCKEKNLRYVFLSTQNIAAHAVEGGQTLENLLSTHPSLENVDVFIFEEIGLYSETDLDKIYLIRKFYPNKLFICLGDFNQLPPPCGRSIGKNKTFLKLFSNVIELKTNYRNDLDYSLTYDVDDFEKNNNIEDFKMHIAYTNNTRRRINEKCMEKNKPPNAEKITIRDNNVDTFMYLYDDLPLRSISNMKSKKIYNGQIFKLSELTLDRKDIIKNFVPAYCLTLYGIQGMTIDEPYLIHDIPYIKSDYRRLYTAISRTTKKENIYFNV